ncbi:MAG: SAM-dependent methyltransferase [Gammaproteobacteria bacterium]|nr:SAM-dependent methyltransferase [Gammaproteobacteria bacterium]MDH4255215.1 SAM-dependent methyltransferase [Gammaproteobacteria bacterium]MDH5308767.1 SAM-dependent methyltransferase [Gammaproteobacteria bacterium]
MQSRLKSGITMRLAALALGALSATALYGAHHTLAERIASETRSADDRARDAGRRPAQVLEFLGVEAGMSVIDIMAAGGWYTEVLSLAVGPDGRVAAQNPDFILRFRDGANDKALNARLADGRLPNVIRLDKNFGDLAAADGPFDVALSALNFHDVYNRDGAEAAVAMLESVKSVLKPGGVFGVIDHAGNAGTDNAALHRIEKSRVVEAAEAAGFVVESESDVLHFAEDDRTQNVFSEGLRGMTDRFVLKLRKPAE